MSRPVIRWTSQFVHVTIDSLDNHDAYLGEPFVVYTQGGRPSRRKPDLGDTALFNTVSYLHRILLAGFRGLGQPYPDELSKPALALLKSYVKERSHVLRYRSHRIPVNSRPAYLTMQGPVAGILPRR